MKYLLILLATVFISQSQCAKKNATPSCILAKIEEIKAQPKWNPPATVSEYEYGRKKVYLFSSDCCDQYNSVFDSDCNYICAPSGGITGNGDGKCSDFNSNAKFSRKVWQDTR